MPNTSQSNNLALNLIIRYVRFVWFVTFITFLLDKFQVGNKSLYILCLDCNYDQSLFKYLFKKNKKIICSTIFLKYR